VKERCEVTNDGRVTEHVTTTDVPYKGKDEVIFYILSLEAACCYKHIYEVCVNEDDSNC